jgi:hypothetical protein
VLLKIYLYRYLGHVQSSRRLEREAQRNIELMWLVERLAPDFKTIADFRKDNGEVVAVLGLAAPPTRLTEQAKKDKRLAYGFREDEAEAAASTRSAARRSRQNWHAARRPRAGEVAPDRDPALGTVLRDLRRDVRPWRDDCSSHTR